jgi:hypothetical protein
MSQSIEHTVLRYDRRRIGRLQTDVGERFCTDAADYLLRTTGPILIGTGFYIAYAEKPETDGPPGAIALARALKRLGREVAFLTDETCAPVMHKVRDEFPLHVLSLESGAAGRVSAWGIRDAVRPGLLIAIERCGPDANDRFLQFDGTDITRFTGRMDYLFDGTTASIGVVDGGNEIGIGSVATRVASLPGLPNSPCVVATDKVVLGSVANWGAYGLIAALSLATGVVLLPSVEEEHAIRAAVVAAGAIDGDSGEPIGAVDGYPSELNALVIERLHRLVQEAQRMR